MTGEGRPRTATLNKDEGILAWHMARKRYEAAITDGTHAALHSKDDDLRVEFVSFAAELAYCKLYNLYPEMEIGTYLHYDAINGGATVDIKQTAREGGRLIVPVKERRELPDYYALMIGRFPSYRLAGHIAAGVLLVEARIDYKLPHPAYCATQQELRDL